MAPSLQATQEQLKVKILKGTIQETIKAFILVETLSEKLEKRPPRDELEHHNIMKKGTPLGTKQRTSE